MKIRLLLVLFLFHSIYSLSQETFPANGAKDLTSQKVCITNAHVHVDAVTSFTNSTLLVQNGKVLAINEPAPGDAVIVDAKGKHVYPSFIDLFSSYGMPVAASKERSYGPQYESSKKGAFGWNETINPERRASLMVKHDSKKAKALRASGFGTVLTHYADGIHRGSGTVITLGESENRNMLLPEAAAVFSFSKGKSKQSYPNSLMGVTALIRQTYCDAEWYNSSKNVLEENLTLSAWNEISTLPQIFDTKEMLDILRANEIAQEFGVKYIMKGNGDEYQRLADIKATNSPLIIPVNFPLPFDVSDPYLNNTIEIDELKHWELAPYNPFFLEDNGIEFCFTASGLKNQADFLDQITKAIKCGLSPEGALKALTETPAKLMRLDKEVGKLRPGYWANFIVTDKELFQEGTAILENWIQGKKHQIKEPKNQSFKGEYNLAIGKELFRLRLGDEKNILLSQADKDKHDSLGVHVNIDVKPPFVTMNFSLNEETGTYFLTGANLTEGKILEGTGVKPHGENFEWVAIKQNSDTAHPQKPKTKKPNDSIVLEDPYDLLIYPFVAYGTSDTLEQEILLIKDATIWTCDSMGILKRGQILLADGIIKAVGESIDLETALGKNWEELDVITIDGYGLHITPGIIDEHSHIAITRGVNEGSQASTAEVRIGDSVNSEDVNIYRQLAGGVTTSQLLHGSANPIGGQSALIKLRWGKSPQEMKYENAPGFIKFALGENVKQSNWGSFYNTRFPQSRMGVEQVYYDHFHKARTYDLQWKIYNSELNSLTKRQRKKGELPVPPRKDIELEALAEVLNSERFVTCHSYMQHEINMLMHVADSMAFTLNTFTHILEGYKLADKMKAHGAGASSFSDWWAYKYEVKDAIPHNGALLHSQGITVAFNSDDAEMARRLNQEAAKAVKYGGVSEEEALKFVTLNPAKLLHIDDKVGSLSTGKDADVVIWNNHPLSIYATPKATFIDGIRYFDQERDLKIQQAMLKERNRLIQLMAADGGKSGTRKPGKKKSQHYHCNTITNELH